MPKTNSARSTAFCGRTKTSDILAFFIAPGLDAGSVALLVAVSFAASAITAALSLGGGSLMLAVMTLFWPAAVAVPVHGVVQLGSNAGRAILRRAFIQWQFAGWFVLGSAIGAPIGGQVVSLLPDAIFKSAIAVFILWSVWAPQPKVPVRTPMLVTFAGVVTAAIGMVVGIAGPLVAANLRHLEDRRQIVATHAFLTSCQNVFKVLTFVALGFAFGTYLPLTLLLIAVGFVGTALGGVLLDRLPERAFRIAFRLVLSAIAIELLWRVAGQVFGR